MIFECVECRGAVSTIKIDGELRDIHFSLTPGCFYSLNVVNPKFKCVEIVINSIRAAYVFEGYGRRKTVCRDTYDGEFEIGKEYEIGE